MAYMTIIKHPLGSTERLQEQAPIGITAIHTDKPTGHFTPPIPRLPEPLQFLFRYSQKASFIHSIPSPLTPDSNTASNRHGGIDFNEAR
ncbi:hypothetical protein SAMN05216387_11719 [Nitrosovibrio tenuis]|uniref:Uncharacterized protein n=1 Tax=Nitrosovibrio tenuis TaxID=1233 RepID=A0A1H7RGL2_9PROT|nr:hypothetical protein SAMN05216387_11719 [Nitrosovibrio tenuis]